MVITGSHMEFPHGFLLWGFTKGVYNGFFLLRVFNNHAINKIITKRLMHQKICANITEMITRRLMDHLKYIPKSMNNNTAINKIITMRLIYQLKYVLKSMNNNHTINK